MPRFKLSQRKPKALTKVTADPKKRKAALVETVQASIDEYTNIFAIGIDHISHDIQDQVRELADVKIIWGKRTVLAAALGRDANNSHRGDVWKLAEHLPRGMTCGLLFTNDSHAIDKLKEFVAEAFAIPGDAATETVVLPAGALDTNIFSGSGSMYDHLQRVLGIPVRLEKGILHLDHEYEVCAEGQPLTAAACKILHLLGKQSHTAQLTLSAHWSPSGLVVLE